MLLSIKFTGYEDENLSNKNDNAGGCKHFNTCLQLEEAGLESRKPLLRQVKQL